MPSSFSRRNETASGSPAKKTTAGEAVGTSRSRSDAPQRVTVLVLKSSETYTVAKYRIDGDLLRFEDLNGPDGAVEASKVDWLKTAEMTRDARSLVTAGISRLHLARPLRTEIACGDLCILTVVRTLACN